MSIQLSAGQPEFLLGFDPFERMLTLQGVNEENRETGEATLRGLGGLSIEVDPDNATLHAAFDPRLTATNFHRLVMEVLDPRQR
jgi:hypothetical protein